jgi:hypothetical protein
MGRAHFQRIRNRVGTHLGNRIRLSINGGGISGSMAVTTNGRSQAVSVLTDGTAVKGVNISLSRD